MRELLRWVGFIVCWIGVLFIAVWVGVAVIGIAIVNGWI